MCVSVQKTAENAGQFVKGMFGIKEEIWPFTICTSVLGEICHPVYLGALYVWAVLTSIWKPGLDGFPASQSKEQKECPEFF